MSTIPQTAETLQSVFGSEIEEIGQRTGLIPRFRKFTAVLLLKMLVFTLLKSPRAKNKDYVSTAAQLGLTITERAVEKRFTPQLVAFLREVLQGVLQKTVAAMPVDTQAVTWPQALDKQRFASGRSAVFPPQSVRAVHVAIGRS